MPIIKKGDSIGICATSSPVARKSLETAVKYFEEKGFKVKLSNNIYAKERFMAGTDEMRGDDIMSLFTDSEIKAIFAARGGYGSSRILKQLDYEKIKKSNAVFIGFSDTTALQMALLAKAQKRSITGLALCSDFADEKLDKTIENSLWDIVEEKPFSATKLSSNHKGKAKGALIGGCLSLISTVIGTEFMPETKGAILVIEEIAEEPYKIDRMLTQLENAGIFDSISGLVFGEFKNCTAKNKEDGSIEQVIAEYTEKLNIPVLSNLPYGHGKTRFLLPLGKEVFIDSDKGTFSF